MSKWIGFAGKMGSGKDHSFDWLHERQYPVVRVSFADGLRFEIERELGLSKPITKPYSELERKLQQWWGTDYRRAQNPNYWVDLAEERAKTIQGDTGMTPVFTDVRFPNEADMIKRNGGLIVRLSASERNRKERLGVDELPGHESEIALDNYSSDVWIPTDLSKARYERDMRGLVKRAGLE